LLGETAGGNRTIRVVYSVFDGNHSPPQLVAVASHDLAIADNAKGDKPLPLQKPAMQQEAMNGATAADGDFGMGFINTRYSVKVTRPAPKFVDENADVVLSPALALRGTIALVPEQRVFAWFHITSDPSWCARFEKAVVAAAVAYFASNPPSKPSKRGAAAELPPSTFTHVLERRWKCKRSHQVWTKLRIAAERHLLGLGLVASEKGVVAPEEELKTKTRWKELAYIRSITVARAKAPDDPTERSPWGRKAKDAVDRVWAFYATGELPPEGPALSLSLAQRSAMGVAAFSKAHYEYFQAALLQMLVPSIDPTLAAAIAKEDIENDPFVTAPKPPKEPKESGSPTAGLAASVSSPYTPQPAPKAADLFAHAVNRFAEWWCDTVTEDEYVRVVKAALPAIQGTLERAKAAEAALDAALRPGSAKKKKGGGKKKKA
jgi:hypothetical protein